LLAHKINFMDSNKHWNLVRGREIGLCLVGSNRKGTLNFGG